MRDYPRYLVKSGETLAAMLLIWVNLAHYQSLMQGIRSAVEAGRLAEHAAEVAEGWVRGMWRRCDGSALR